METEAPAKRLQLKKSPVAPVVVGKKVVKADLKRSAAIRAGGGKEEAGMRGVARELSPLSCAAPLD